MSGLDRGARLKIAACVSRTRGERLTASLEGDAALECFGSFTDLLAAPSAANASLVIADLYDPSGQSVDVMLLGMRGRSVPVILYASSNEVSEVLPRIGIADVIIAELTDAPALVRAIIGRSVMRVAADRVIGALRTRLSGPTALAAETAVRHPSCNTVEQLADRLGVHRQTLALWCRNQRILRPEELLIWCRLLLIAALLERTPYTASGLAMSLEFPSVIALRNQLKRYTGLTAQQIRQLGLEEVLVRFDGDMAAAQGHGTERPQELTAAL